MKSNLIKAIVCTGIYHVEAFCVEAGKLHFISFTVADKSAAEILPVCYEDKNTLSSVSVLPSVDSAALWCLQIKTRDKSG